MKKVSKTKKELEKKITFWKGRVALFAILKALEIGPGDAVLLPGYTCMVVPSAAVFLGATPVYADVEEASYNVTRETLEDAWRAHNGPRPKAVIIQHTYGIPVEAEPILDWARSQGLAIIEDCAHVLGSTYHGVPCGSLGDAAFFSGQWSKPLTTGLGGWAFAGSLELNQRLSQVAATFQTPNFRETATLGVQFYAHRLLFRPQLYWLLMSWYRKLSARGLAVGSSSSAEIALEMPRRYALKMSAFQQRLLREALARADNITMHRQGITALYEKKLVEAGFEQPKLPANAHADFVRYPVRVRDKTRLLQEALARRFELGDWFVSPVHPLLDGWEKLGYRRGSCPVAEDLCRAVVNLPTHRRVTPKEASKIAEFLIKS